MVTKLARIAEISETKSEDAFTSLYHFIGVNLLRLCHFQLCGDKAAGVDALTKAQYEENIEENLFRLAAQLASIRGARRFDSLVARFGY